MTEPRTDPADTDAAGTDVARTTSAGTARSARTLATGLEFGESVRWHDGALWVADWITHRILRLTGDGTSEVVVEAGGLPVCFDFLPDGRLVLCSSDESMLLVREPDGTLTPYLDLSGVGSAPWNEVLADGRGNVYVNRLGFVFSEEEPGPGSVVLVRPDGTASEVADDLGFPNGMAMTPDGRTLVVAESWANRLTAFDVAEDGTLSGRRTWADTGGDSPDGITIDAEGAIWYADVASTSCVRVREGGEQVDRVELDRGCFSCALDDASAPSLYVAAQTWTGDWVEPGTGVVVALPAPAPSAARPRA